MARLLIVYASKHGQTEKISNFISAELVQMGHFVDIFDVESIPETVSVQNYEAVIVGAPVYVSGFPNHLKKWVKSHSDILAFKPSGFFSVCLGVLENDESAQKDERQIVEKFFNESNWHPKQWTIFAGSITYSKYNWFLKRIMHALAKKSGTDTEYDHDYEYTDWNKVHQFTENLVHDLGGPR